MRSHYCGDVNKSHVGQEVTLVGWVNRSRDLGGVVFLDLRDREGLIQVVYDPDLPEVFNVASTLRAEFCVQVARPGVFLARSLQVAVLVLQKVRKIKILEVHFRRLRPPYLP